VDVEMFIGFIVRKFAMSHCLRLLSASKQ